MVIQNDKKAATTIHKWPWELEPYNSEAPAKSEVFPELDLGKLPDNTENPDLISNFSFGHDLKAYDKLVLEKYNTDLTKPQDVQSVQLEGYYVPKNEPIAKVETQLEKYYNNSNPITEPFRPKIMGNHLETFIDSFEKERQKEQQLEKIAEAEVDTYEETETFVQAKEDLDYKPFLKLNKKGIVAVLGFAVVVAIVAVLIIVNSVSIGKANGRIGVLTASNADISALVAQEAFDRDQYYNQRAEVADEYVKNPVNGYEKLPESVKLPNLKTWEKLRNIDYSTNFFDALSKFLSKIF